ncbi:MAG: amidase [Acidobacteria bacterium]|nr:MAG: amidase [Acidobacteriota bacterium]
MSRCQPPDPSAPTHLDRRELLACGALALAGVAACAPRDGGSPPEPTTAVAASELDEMGLAEMAAAMEEGRLTARSITEHYLQRIADLDRRGPTLRTVIEVNPDALAIADQLDDERRRGQSRGPLHGIPILLKDNVATHDGTTTTAGSLALEGSIPPADSFVAHKLRQAGAVLLGKANLSEWANFRSTRSSSGWSGRGGQCKNPYALDRNPCGSSSGSGAAVAANLVAAAIGTETNGSIVCPSSANGIVGVKPTVGLVSRSRIIPISHSQDTAGPMARTVRDAALVLGALTGVDPEDPATAASAGHTHDDYVQFLDEGGLKGARIGVSRNHFGFDPNVDQLMEEALDALRKGGAEVIDPVELATWNEIGRPSFQVLLYEFKAGIESYLASLGPGAPARTLADLIAWNETHRDASMPYFGQELFLQAQEKGGLDSPEYLEALETAQRLARSEGIDKVMDEHRLDAVVAPTGSPAWVTDLVNGDHFIGSSSTPAAVAGYPNVTVPAGFVFGLPVGISFFGRAWSEPTLLKLAYAYEQATLHRQPPKFLPTLDLG